jgi:anti-anti-sigma regulatory factor
MVIEACEDVVYVSGALHTNHWSAIKNMVDLISAGYPCGVMVDFGNVTFFSKLGIMTFSEALCDIENRGLPITLVNLPPSIQIFSEAFSSESCQSDSRQEYYAETEEARRIYTAIYSETWWQRLWGTLA